MTQTIEFQETDVQVYYLEMNEKPSLDVDFPKGVNFEKLEKPVSIEEYRFYYNLVGEKYSWIDRLLLSDKELDSKINNQDTDIFVFKVLNNAAGYVEFVRKSKNIEIQYFGLAPDFIGKGLGKKFLGLCINEAWNYRPKQVKVNTCSLDNKYALKVYMDMGFKLVETKIEKRKVRIN